MTKKEKIINAILWFASTTLGFFVGNLLFKLICE